MVDDASCHLSCYTSTHASIWYRYEDIGSRDVIGHVTIRLMGVDFLWVVHSDHACI